MKKHRRKQIVMGSVIIFIMIASIWGRITNTVLASTRGENRTKMVTSILVKEDDTLWDIATQYYTEEYSSISKYIKEIKKSNGLQTDHIHAGYSLIIPYYGVIE